MTKSELVFNIKKFGIRKVRGDKIDDMHEYALMRIYDWLCNKDNKLSELPVVSVDTIHCECCGNTMTRDEYMENNSKCLFCK